MIFSGFTYGQDAMSDNLDYVELGLVCADVCMVIERGMRGRQLDDIHRSVYEAITQLVM